MYFCTYFCVFVVYFLLVAFLLCVYLVFLHMCKFVNRNRILVDWEAGSGHGGFKFAPYVIVIRLVAVMRLFIQLSQLHDYKLKWSL